MSEHLLECPIPDFDKMQWVCICNQLRACEQRVRAEETLAVSRKRGYSDALIDAREAIGKTHLPIPVIQCACGWGVNCPECGTESNRTVGYVCRECCDDWGDYGYCDDMHNENDSPSHHVDGEMWSGPYCPVIAAIEALREDRP